MSQSQDNGQIPGRDNLNSSNYFIASDNERKQLIIWYAKGYHYHLHLRTMDREGVTDDSHIHIGVSTKHQLSLAKLSFIMRRWGSTRNKTQHLNYFLGQDAQSNPQPHYQKLKRKVNILFVSCVFCVPQWINLSSHPPLASIMWRLLHPPVPLKFCLFINFLWSQPPPGGPEGRWQWDHCSLGQSNALTFVRSSVCSVGPSAHVSSWRRGFGRLRPCAVIILYILLPYFLFFRFAYSWLRYFYFKEICQFERNKF